MAAARSSVILTPTSTAEQQLSDIDTLISKGAQVLVILAQDNKAILPAVQKAKDAGIPVIAYDRLIEDPSGSVLYLSFDNVAVGKAEADAILQKVPKGNYVLIKGDPGDANASTFLPQGWDLAGLKDKIASGDIKIIGDPKGTFTDAWKTEKAQANMEAIIDQANSPTRRSTRSSPRTTARRSASRRPHGQELRVPAAERSGWRPRQPEQPGPWQAVRRRLEERQRAGQGSRSGRLQLCANKDLSKVRTSLSTRRSRRRRATRRPTSRPRVATP